jgi:hypothetical protein
MWRRKRKWRPKTVMSSKAILAALLASLSSIFLLVVCFTAVHDLLVVPSAIAIPLPQKLKPTDPYALIFGTVWGPDNHPVYGVKVEIRRVGHKKPKWQLTSDHVGEFAQRVPASKADYEVWADLKGVKSKDGDKLHLAQKVSVHVEYDERVDIGLHLTR